jgi:enterochelin esterase-like enzyme
MTENQQTQGAIKILRHESEILKNNRLGDRTFRDLYVYLPPDYDEDKQYPTVYCLTGFTGRGKMFLNDNAFAPNLAERMDKLIGEKTNKPMIAVLPDCFTRLSAARSIRQFERDGQLRRLFNREIVPFVDEQFRTIKDKNSAP